MSYAELVPVLVKAIQEQQQSIATLNAQNVALVANNAALGARLASLEESTAAPVLASTH
jgi:hypothetical protein